MQTEKTFLDDLARLATGAFGALGDVKGEVEARVRAQLERILSRMNLPTREELDAVTLVLAFGQGVDGRQEHGDVPLLLLLDGGCRMFPCDREIRTVVRALDLDQPLGAAADRANRLAECRAQTLGLSRPAGGAGHERAIIAVALTGRIKCLFFYTS